MNQIYKITNNVNSKVYIGLTTQNVNRRWSEHLYRFNLGERDHKLYKAMKKHGIDNFNIEVIENTNDKNLLPELEKEYINKFDSYNNGYNMTIGGDTVSDETRLKLSKIFKNRNITWGQKIVDTKRERYSDWPCGKPVGKEHWKAKKYIVTFPDGNKKQIPGLRKFCREYNLSHNLMIAVLQGKQRHHKGYVLSTFNDYPEMEYTQVSGNGEYPVTLAG